jgi:hypothetical protein
MTKGKEVYNGLAVPLFGEFELKQRTAATDIMTISGASGQTGDFIVAATAGTEVFSVEDSGRVVAADWPTISATPHTTLPAAGMVAGQVIWYQTSALTLRTVGYATGAGSIWKVPLTNNT